MMTVAVASVALAVNFWIYMPTFTPYGVPYPVVGAVFAGLGVSELVFLNVVRDLRLVRLTVTASIGVMLAWGIANTEQVFAGKASFQLPIMYVAIAVIQVWLLLEPPINPMTERKR